MWHTLALWLLAFALAWVENVIVTRGGRADRQSTSCRTSKFSIIAANWDVAFGVVLLIDTALVVTQGYDLILPIAAGSWLGTYTELERRRAKFRARTKRRKSPRTSSTSQESQTPDASQADG